jgi:chorismate mutase / prephenate dehydratase
MQRIESRPVIEKSWEYFFYIDFEGNLKDENLRKAIVEIERNSTYFKLLGNYKSHI